MCFVFTVLFLGPRFGLLLYWIGWPGRWDATFDGWLAPFIGFLIAPWTTLAWVLCAPGGIVGFDHVVVGCALLGDMLTLAGGGGSYRKRPNPSAPGMPTSTY